MCGATARSIKIYWRSLEGVRMDLLVKNFIVITWPILKALGTFVLATLLFGVECFAMMRLLDSFGFLSHEAHDFVDSLLGTIVVFLALFITAPIVLAIYGIEAHWGWLR